MNRKILLSLSLVAMGITITACNKTCRVDGVAGSIAPGSAEDLAANVPNTVYFDFDKSAVSDAARKRIEAQACWLKTYGATKATIEGHCDVRGTNEYNMALGEARATAVSKELKTQGVDASRLTTVSYGKERPIDDGINEVSHAKNRRATTVIGG
ncbi:MAG: peptidoglycan-associated lipoprotein Pal [Holosporales bacterium]|jgi:peptidoglycan-associated lipoprotein|nr:peptidoglycan-associated lipoprotein Pal [Holosporales bacterium]